jgi:hypothetical protein
MRRTVSLLLLLLAACSAPPVATQPTRTETALPTLTTTSTVTAIPPATVTSTPQPRRLAVDYGPDSEDFPPTVNPLTGREVLDPPLLKLPAVLVSISNMPVTARPQAGPAFAAWVHELYIGEGTTRFLSVFYGEFPRAVPNVHGGCEVRDDIIFPNENWIGNRVLLDEDEKGRQDAWETGVGGVCVRLLDGVSREEIA